MRAACLITAALGLIAHAAGQPLPPPRVLLLFGLNVEADHMLFATDALRFFAEVGDKLDCRVEAMSNWADLNDDNLKQYKLVVWLNGGPPKEQHVPFQRFKENGGLGWLSCVRIYFRLGMVQANSSAAHRSASTIGPLPAKVIVDDTESPVTHGSPKTFIAPINEWYSWRPSPRLDKSVHVLLTVDPSQYPLGIKGLITEKDPVVPVVWTNTRYKVLYMNMGAATRSTRDPPKTD